MVKTLHQMLILTTPCRRARRDTRNQVLVHPIQSLDDKVMSSGRSLDKPGWIWTQGGAGAAPFDTRRPRLVSNGHQTWSRASTLTQEPMGSLVLHIGSHGAQVKPGQCDPIQHKARTEEAKLQT